MITSRPRHALVLLFALVVGLAALPLMGASLFGIDPLHAPFIDNQPHTLEANSDTWFKFDYGTIDSTRPLVMLSLVNGAASGMRFEVWAAKDIGSWWENQPVGKGTVAPVDCNTGLPAGGGACRSSDVTWSGAFGGAGTFYVRVINDHPAPQVFLLVVQGTTVTLGPAAAAPSGPTATGTSTLAPPTHTSTPGPGPIVRDDPAFAVPIDGQLHTLPGNAATWFKFDYGSEGLPRQVVSLRLANGVQTMVRFEVWAPENLDHWWEKKPAGRGTQEIIVGCNPPAEATATVAEDEPTPTPEPPSGGHCPTNDLTWSGAFGGPGTFYVRVVNDNGSAMDYVLTLQ